MSDHCLYRLRFKPVTAFATPLRGDTLFGQCCWQLRQQGGERALTGLLDGYLDDNPFLVLSDAFPAGYLPRPVMPLGLLGFDLGDPTKRKSVKGQRWLPHSTLSLPLSQWHSDLATETAIAEALPRSSGQPCQPLWQESVRTHNSLNRLTNTTGTGEGFAPFERELTWYHPALELDVFAACDDRLDPEDLQALLANVGQAGYGKEASSGLGKFEVIDCSLADFPQPDNANAWLTLAPAAPQGGSWLTDQCYYEVHVRFGRHGMAPETAGGNPWKNPILMAETGAMLTPSEFDPGRVFTGRGLSGVSRAIAGTVHQGYAPVVAVAFKFDQTAQQGGR